MVEKAKEGTLKPVTTTNGEVKAKKRGRWDQTVDTDASAPKKKAADATWEKDEVCEFLIYSFILFNGKNNFMCLSIETRFSCIIRCLEFEFLEN